MMEKYLRHHEGSVYDSCIIQIQLTAVRKRSTFRLQNKQKPKRQHRNSKETLEKADLIAAQRPIACLIFLVDVGSGQQVGTCK
jgi:hypothetical protein